MKHSKKIIAAMLLTMGTSSAQAVETIIDFEDQTLTTGVSTLDEIAIGDVTFKAGTLNGGAPSFLISDINTNPSENHNIFGTYLTNGINGFTSLEISFANSISQFSFNLKSQVDTAWTLTAFDSSDNMIGASLDITLPQGNGYYYGTFGLSSLDSSFSYAILADTQPAVSFFGAQLVNEIELDNLTYTTEMAVSPVPEPSTYALMLGGLGMVGFMAYRRRKATSA